MDRRVFMKSGAMALVTMGLSPSFLRRTAYGAELLRGASVGGNARGVRESVEPLPLRCREKIPGGAGAIVEIEGCGGDEAATRHGGIGSPAEPAVEVGTDPRLAPFGPGGGTDHGIAEPLGGAAQHLELERVLGADVGKEPALGEPELGGEAADGESVEPIAAGDAFGVGEDAVAGGG